jgi:ketosteroid isomerase-like protein
MKTRTVLMLLAPMIGAAAALPAMSDNPLRTAQGSSAAWYAAFDHGAYDRLGEAYTENAVVLAPASTRLDGRAAIADYWRRVGAVDGKVSVAMRSADVDGSEMLQTGVWGVEMTTASGEVVRQGGNLLRVMEEDGDGGWRIKLESWN